MEKYNYLEAIKADVKTYIDDEINMDDFSGPAEDREDLRQELEGTPPAPTIAIPGKLKKPSVTTGTC